MRCFHLHSQWVLAVLRVGLALLFDLNGERNECPMTFSIAHLYCKNRYFLAP